MGCGSVAVPVAVHYLTIQYIHSIHHPDCRTRQSLLSPVCLHSAPNCQLPPRVPPSVLSLERFSPALQPAARLRRSDLTGELGPCARPSCYRLHPPTPLALKRSLLAKTFCSFRLP